MNQEGLVFDEYYQIAQTTTIYPIAPETLDYFLGSDQKTGLSQVFLTETDKLAGVLIAQSFDEEAHIEKFGVIKAFRKDGIGKQLMHAFATRAAVLGIKSANLMVFRSNKPAVRAYTRYGFEAVYDDHTSLGLSLFVKIDQLLKNTSLKK